MPAIKAVVLALLLFSAPVSLAYAEPLMDWSKEAFWPTVGR